MRVVLYARVSTQRQADNDLSIPDQFRQLREHCLRHEFEIIREFQDPGASATDDNRPGFQEMIAFALDRPNHVEAILVLTTSRFFRDVLGARIYKQKLSRRGVKVISITQEVGDGPSGELIQQIFESMDEYESRMNAFHTLRGMKENARRGNFNGSRPPYGYRVHCEGDGESKSKSRLVVDPEEATIVRLIFALYVDGLDGKRLGIKALTEHLNSHGHPYREGKIWTKQRIQERLADKTYIGESYFNRVKSKTREVKPESEWILVPVDPIVSEDLFRRAEEIRKRDRPTKNRPPSVSGSTSLLTGLLHCGKCGARMSVEVAKSGRYRYYTCSAYVCSGKSSCSGTRVPMAELDRQVLEYLGERLFTIERMAEVVRQLSKELAVLRQSTSKLQSEVQLQLVEVRQRIRRQYEAVEAGAIELTLVAERLRELKETEAALLERLQRAAGPGQVPPYLFKESSLRGIQQNLMQAFMTPQSGVAKKYVTHLLQRIEVEGEEVRIDACMANVLTLDDRKRKDGTVNQSGQSVPSIVLNWLPALRSNRSTGSAVGNGSAGT